MESCRWDSPGCPGKTDWTETEVIRRAQSADPGLSDAAWHKRHERARNRVSLPVDFEPDPTDLRHVVMRDRCQCEIDAWNKILEDSARDEIRSLVTLPDWVQKINGGLTRCAQE